MVSITVERGQREESVGYRSTTEGGYVNILYASPSSIWLQNPSQTFVLDIRLRAKSATDTTPLFTTLK
jgi:hypothetical protein